MALAPAAMVAEMLAGFAAAGDDGHIRELLPDLCHHPGRVGAAGHIQDGCPGINAALDVGVLFCHCDDDRNVHHPQTASRFRSEMGELSTTPMAPWLSTSRARFRVRTPWVVPPPTPQNTGM